MTANPMIRCGRGICAAEEGHEGTCDEASGWAETECGPDCPQDCGCRVDAGPERAESGRGTAATLEAENARLTEALYLTRITLEATFRVLQEASGLPDDMTPERYAAELDAWWTARNAERKADANG